MAQQIENEHKIKEAILILNVCLCDRDNTCLLVKQVSDRYNKPSLINNSSNKKLGRTVTSGNRSEIHHSRINILY